jgi:hypothetical protein
VNRTLYECIKQRKDEKNITALKFNDYGPTTQGRNGWCGKRYEPE